MYFLEGHTLCSQQSITLVHQSCMNPYSVPPVSGNVGSSCEAKSYLLGAVAGETGPQCGADERSFLMFRPLCLIM